MLPLAPAPMSFTVNATSFSALSQSPFSAAQQVQLLQGQLWSFSVSYPPMSDDQARTWFSRLSQLLGRYGTFYFGDPRCKRPRGAWAGTPIVNGGTQTGQTLAISGFTVGTDICGGDYFQLSTGSSSRLHMVTQDAVADGSGNITADIWPRLRESPTNSGAIVTATPQGVFRLATSNVSKTFEPFRNGISLEIVEAL